MKRLVPAFAIVTSAFLMGCQEVPTEVSESAAPLFKKGGGKPGGGGAGSPAAPEIVFRNQGSDLAVMDADGANVTVLLFRDDFGVNLNHPTWSPLGSGAASDPYSVLFSFYPQLARVEFYVDAGGSVVSAGWTTVATGTAYAGEAEYSPDGSQIAFTGSEPSSCGVSGDIPWRSLYLVPADGSAPATEVHCSSAPLGIYNPSWSPDGTAIAFHEEFDDDDLAVIGESAIRVCNLGPGGCTITTAVDRTEADHLWGPEWLNDGSALLYTSSEGKWGSVFRISLTHDGSGWIRVPGSAPEFVVSGRNPSSSPDDSQIVVTGLSIFDAVTLEKTRAPKGTSPDWRVPAQ